MKSGTTLVFSTGSTIPTERINGIVFDWARETPAPQAYIEAVTPDSIIYLAQSDTLGKFSVGPLPPGTYLVRALIDANNNRVFDRNEMFDSVRVTVPQQNPAELLAAVRDTFPTRLLTVDAKDSLTIMATFDRGVDPTVPLTTSLFVLMGPDSTVIPLARVMTPRETRIADSVAQRAKIDSVRRADSLAGKPLPAVVNNPPLQNPLRPGARPAPPPAKPSRAPPFTIVTLIVGQPLKPNTPYRLSVSGVRSLTGRSQSSTRSFTTPKPPPPAAKRDSAAVRRDSAQKSPTTPPSRSP
jgi:hypothetical protein